MASRSAERIPLVPGGAGTTPGLVTGSALPDAWDALWGPAPPANLPRKQLARLRTSTSELAADLPLTDLGRIFSALVGAGDLRRQPVHRWFPYKEGFSPSLPATVLDELGSGSQLVIADFFGGVATTALALRGDPRVKEIRSLEYSPLAHAVGNAKLAWPQLDPEKLRTEAGQLLGYRLDRRLSPPGLSAFRDPRIFEPGTVASLQSARGVITGSERLTAVEKDFFLTGLAAVIEDASKAMKDGRALRIRGGRARQPTALLPLEHSDRRWRDPVKRLLDGQWRAMIEDLELLAAQRERAATRQSWHLRGDARRLRATRFEESDDQAFPESSIDVAVYSPPYLNFIDYTEVYKLELWLLGHVRDPRGFRRLRLGTLRSHPSVRFGERPAPKPEDHPVIDLVHRLSGWLTEYGSRPEVGPVVRHYFEDMYQSYREQYRVLKGGGASVCVVANSTFSRREKSGGQPQEAWRVPILTDVMLGHLALLAGFHSVELWRARDLRPRNVRRATARESLVVARKAP